MSASTPDDAGTAGQKFSGHLPEEQLPTSDAEWRERLSKEQFYVTREKGTERAFTGAWWDHKEDGTYHCVCCGAALFESDDKYESGTGWPSFHSPAEGNNVATAEDRGWLMTRTEVLCSRCDAHLGHVFDDGPAPTGLRYCINSAALSFAPEENAAPEQAESPGQNDPAKQPGNRGALATGATFENDDAASVGNDSAGATSAADGGGE